MIETRNLGKAFKGQWVWQNVSFTALPGEHIFICGKSGSGKSVLIKLLTGLLLADAGQIFFDNKEVTHYTEQQWNKLRKEMGVVFQNAALLDSLTIQENVGIRLLEETGGRLTAEIKAKIIEALKSVGLGPEVLTKLPGELSGGMRKRAGIARAIVHKPQILFYDEPTTGLDPINSALIDELIASLSQTTSSITLIASHDMNSLKRLAHKVLLIENNQVHFWGTKDAFLASTDPIIQSFLNRNDL